LFIDAKAQRFAEMLDRITLFFQPKAMGRHMLTAEQHLDNLVRHIELVREACLLLGKRLIARDRQEFGRILIAHGFAHDASKFQGVEWEYLHAGRDVPKACQGQRA
jgi:hypothetical protein